MEVLPLLADPDVAIRQVVAQAVKALKDKPGVTDKLAARLEVESDAGVKAALAESLIVLTPSEASSLPVLRRFLKDSSPKVREESARKIATVAADATAAIPDLIDLIQDKSDAVRVAALTTLAAMGYEAKGAIPAAADLFDRPSVEPVLLAAAQVLGATESEGIKRLESLCLKTLPESVRAEMCKTFCRAKRVSGSTNVWMIEQAETIVDCRVAVATALAKGVAKKEVQELLRRTLTYKPRKRGQKEMKYDLDYRKWSLITLRKLDLSSTANRETRQLVVDRLKYLVENDSTEEIVAEAKATLTALK
jgi:HEAT repeat protein